MSKHFWSRHPAFAGADLGEEDFSFISHWFHEGGRGRHGRRGRRFAEERFGDDWGEEYRVRRGDIKFILLELLSERPSHGYDLIKEMETRYGGFRRLSPGSVYPTLQMLEEGGYLTSEQEGGKRVYTITDAGRELLAERSSKAASDPPWDTLKRWVTETPEELIELRRAGVELADAVKQIARRGNAEKIKRVRERLEQVKREIYTILSEE